MTKQSAQILNISKNNADLIADEAPNLSKLIHGGFHIPDGFLITSEAFTKFLQENQLTTKIKDLLSTIHFERADSLMQVSNHIKNLIINSRLPDHLHDEISTEYKKLGGFLNNASVAVGESNASKIKGIENLILEIKHLWATKFEAQHLFIYQQNNIEFFQIKNPIPVQKIINSKKMGILITSIFSIDTKSRLSNKQKNELVTLGKDLNKHFFFPQVVTWVIENNKIYTISIKPLTSFQQSYLALVRHGTSEYNEKGIWAGWDDPDLTEQGKKDIEIAAESIKDIKFDAGFTSPLKRHHITLEIIKKRTNNSHLRTIVSKSLLERNYGDFTGKNKWEIEKKMGKKEFMKLRRSWDYPIPNGESLKDVYDRIVPYYTHEILPKLKSGKNVIISSSGNALRSLIKYLENISDEHIANVEIAPGEIYLYKIDEDGKIIGREIRNPHPNSV